MSPACGVEIQQLCTDVARWCTSVEDTSLQLLDIEGTPRERVLKETARLALPPIARAVTSCPNRNDLDAYLHNPPEQNIRRKRHGLLMN